MPIKNLQLKNYFFPSVSVEANASFVPPDDNIIGIDIKKNISLAVNEENNRLYQIQLDLNIVPKEGAVIPYNIALKAIGILEVEGDSPDKEGIVRTQGAAILYSAAREFLLGIMFRGPWSPILLPITVFSPQDNKPQDKKTHAKKNRVNKAKVK